MLVLNAQDVRHKFEDAWCTASQDSTLCLFIQSGPDGQLNVVKSQEQSGENRRDESCGAPMIDENLLHVSCPGEFVDAVYQGNYLAVTFTNADGRSDLIPFGRMKSAGFGLTDPRFVRFIQRPQETY